ncbi:MAG: helix-turn-helix domain-containing protein [Nanoarchaeota archaeon]|nr:helix-turn-helix domain-containing protein [Nanoarchaeota archaeon]
MIEESLSKLGFSPSEVKVYLHLVKAGSSYANRISADTKLNRTNVYEALDRLVSKGAISFISKNKVKWFEANKPEKLISLLDEKEDELKKSRKELFSAILSLKNISAQAKPLEASVFTGKKGLRMLFEDILETKKPIYLIAANLQFKEIFGPYFELWHKKRIERKIPQKTILPKKLKNKVEKRELLEYKFIDDKYTSPTTTIVYGENCLLIQWDKEPVAIKISSKQISKSNLNYFNILWASEIR